MSLTPEEEEERLELTRAIAKNIKTWRNTLVYIAFILTVWLILRTVGL